MYRLKELLTNPTNIVIALLVVNIISLLAVFVALPASPSSKPMELTTERVVFHTPTTITINRTKENRNAW